jgi:uncharacterized RDD family membrane protein YckC
METYQETHTAEQEDILVDFENQLYQASGGKRFANYLLDLVGVMIFSSVAELLSLVTTGNSLITKFEGAPLLEQLFFLFLYSLYYGGIEAIFKGRSLGKFITGTKVVNEDGSGITAAKAFTRALCRCVPFEPFSALGSPSHPWHDKWTKTLVIDIKKSPINP